MRDILKCLGTAIALYLVMAHITTSAAPPARDENVRAKEAYRVGTNVGMQYLSQHAGRLRVALLLSECDLSGLAAAVGNDLPQAVDYFFGRPEAQGLDGRDAAFASQVTRAYVVGFEAAIRTGFSRQWKGDAKKAACSNLATIADSFLAPK